jgi:hypothetical protein
LIEENVKYLLGKDIDRTGSTMIIVIVTEDRKADAAGKPEEDKK